MFKSSFYELNDTPVSNIVFIIEKTPPLGVTGRIGLFKKGKRDEIEVVGCWKGQCVNNFVADCRFMYDKPRGGGNGEGRGVRGQFSIDMLTWAPTVASNSLNPTHGQKSVTAWPPRTRIDVELGLRLQTSRKITTRKTVLFQLTLVVFGWIVK